ncbi:MAG: hypothetical protein ACYC27_22500 [Armatimonadota bacterium]
MQNITLTPEHKHLLSEMRKPNTRNFEDIGIENGLPVFRDGSATGRIRITGGNPPEVCSLDEEAHAASPDIQDLLQLLAQCGEGTIREMKVSNGLPTDLMILTPAEQSVRRIDRGAHQWIVRTDSILPQEDALLTLMREVKYGAIFNFDIVNGLPVIDENIKIIKCNSDDDIGLMEIVKSEWQKDDQCVLCDHYLSTGDMRDITPENHARQDEIINMLHSYNQFWSAHVILVEVFNALPKEMATILQEENHYAVTDR